MIADSKFARALIHLSRGSQKTETPWFLVHLLPSQVQWSRLRAPSTLFQCARWKKEYARASLSPRFNICSGGRTRLFCSNKYYRKMEDTIFFLQYFDNTSKSLKAFEQVDE